MTIKTTTSHTLTFAVEAFWSEEGGMGSDSYGQPTPDLPAAIRLLELARVEKPKTDWVITIDVKTTTSQ